MTTVAQPKSGLTAWERWELASFDHHEEPAPKAVPLPDAEPEIVLSDAERLALVRENARREGEAAGRSAGYDAGFAEGRTAGYTEGHQQGLAAGSEEGRAATEGLGRAEAEKLAQIVAKLETHIQELGPTVASELLDLSLEVARQVVRQTITMRPDVLLTVIREALTQLPLQQAAIHLHPDDAALVRRLAGEEIAHAGHRIREDPKLAVGDVVIESGGSHLDATLANRWARIVATLGRDAPWITTEPE